MMKMRMRRYRHAIGEQSVMLRRHPVRSRLGVWRLEEKACPMIERDLNAQGVFWGHLFWSVLCKQVRTTSQ